MNSAEELIYQYEVQRGTVARLNKERKLLINECDNVIPHKSIEGLVHGPLCLNTAWHGESFLDAEPDEQYDYALSLEEIGCEACKKSFAIKRGPLMSAKKELGNIKRRLSVFGKKLIKESAK